MVSYPNRKSSIILFLESDKTYTDEEIVVDYCYWGDTIPDLTVQSPSSSNGQQITLLSVSSFTIGGVTVHLTISSSDKKIIAKINGTVDFDQYQMSDQFTITVKTRDLSSYICYSYVVIYSCPADYLVSWYNRSDIVATTSLLDLKCQMTYFAISTFSDKYIPYFWLDSPLTPSYDDYTFTSWCPFSNQYHDDWLPEGVYYSRSSSIYAQYTGQATVQLIYNVDGSQGWSHVDGVDGVVPSTQRVNTSCRLYSRTGWEYDPVSVTVSDTILAKAGYILQGWAYSQSATEAVIRPGDTISIPHTTRGTGNGHSRTIIYAIWESASVTISYNANGGTLGSVPESEVFDDAKIVIPADSPSRDGYRFLGWAYSADASSAIEGPGDQTVVAGDTTFYAIWTRILTVSYDATGGSPTPDPDTGTSSETTSPLYRTTIAAAPKRSGYVFMYWTDSPPE